MRSLRRNDLVFYYAPYDHTADVVDEDGNLTGDTRVIYGTPRRCLGCCTAAGGTGTAGFNKTKYNPFGEDKHFDYVVSMDVPKDFDIGEAGVMWMDPTHYDRQIEPVTVDEDGILSRPYEFEVKRISFSRHTVTLAVRNVRVSE